MRPIMQSKLVERDGEGDCLRACVASILERELDDIPELMPSNDRTQTKRLREWLLNQRYDMVHVLFTGCYDEHSALFDAMTIPCIIGGWSPRESKRAHAVVGTCERGKFKIIHDPHPSDAGIVGHPIDLMWFVPRVFSK